MPFHRRSQVERARGKKSFRKIYKKVQWLAECKGRGRIKGRSSLIWTLNYGHLGGFQSAIERMHKCCSVAVLLPGSLALLLWSVTALVPPLDAGLPVVRISAPSAVATESGTSNGLVTIS